MVVNSIKFWMFFIIVLIAYYGLFRKSSKLQNLTLLISSYIFYGIVDWKMCALLFAATGAFYYLGVVIAKYNANNERLASILTTIGVVLGIGMLIYFKYLDFFVEQFGYLLTSIGLKNNTSTFGIIMPLGISFFTFKLIAYVVEVHRGKIEPSRDPIAFGTFIAFFPTILSGPIDRPGKFLPQLKSARKIDADMLTRGCQQILWGMFKKMVIADNLMSVIETSWDITTLSGSTYLLAALLYTIQMYTDFSGYSDMAIGVGKILGLKIAENFNYPFFSRNVSEYWRKWHMSLTSWLTDYVFMPLNIKFRNYGKYGMIAAIIINMLLVGFWHGANWTFGFFGLYHSLLFIPLIFSGAFMSKKKMKTGKFDLPSFKDFASMILTFILVTIGLVIFKADSVADAFNYFAMIAQPSILNLPKFMGMDNSTVLVTIVFIAGLIIADWRNRKIECPLFFENSHGIKAIIYYVVIVSSIYFVGGDSSSFIYFKF